jgi:predicted enzyme related to lactoylglutathione lyase
MARIEHFAIFARDLERLRAFYEDAFGLKVIVDNSKAPIRGYFLADDRGCVLEVIERPEGVAAGDTHYVCHTAFAVEDYDAARAELERRGIRFEADSAVVNENVRTAFFLDPEGNRTQIVWRSRPLGA